MSEKNNCNHENQVEKLIQKGRENIQERIDERQAMIESLSASFSSLGVSAIEMGNETIHLKEKEKTVVFQTQEEAYFTQLLNTGSQLYMLTVNNDCVGYAGQEKVRCQNQKLSTLIDENLIKQLAPKCIIYAPQDKRPWNDIYQRSSFEIYLTDYQELVNLWESIPSWAKLDWHDNILKTEKYHHQAQTVFGIDLFHSFAPDLSWRYAQFKNAEKKEEQVQDLGEWNALAQQELKKTINSLLYIEEHPVLGNEIANIIKSIKPMLAQSMKGKELLQAAKKEREKAQNHLYRGIKLERIDWKNWTKEIPIKEQSNAKKKKM